MTENAASPWLELSDAADLLGVHFTTLRRWADAGQVPCIRTPGGRRRFNRMELTAFLAGLHSGELADNKTPKLGLSQPIAPLTHTGLSREPWYPRLDEAQRAAMRVEGQGLLAVMLQYATRTNGGDVFLEEGRRVASRYGIACQRVGLTLGETVHTFINVRRGIMDSVYQAGALAGAPDNDTWRLYDRMNTFLDNMLLAMLESFDTARTLSATAPDLQDRSVVDHPFAQGSLP